MAVLLVLFGVSLGGVAVALGVPGWSDLLLLAGPAAIASLLLLVARFRAARVLPRPAPKWIVIDGSNIMYWREATPQIETVREVVRHLASRGYETGVMFDANAGYLLSGKYQHDGHFGRLLDLPEDRVMVVPKGTPADKFILIAARDLGARIVTNDRFRDWADDHPEIRTPGHLVRGEFRSGQLWLDLEPDPVSRDTL